jgi:hypothetical protein
VLLVRPVAVDGDSGGDDPLPGRDSVVPDGHGVDPLRLRVRMSRHKSAATGRFEAEPAAPPVADQGWSDSLVGWTASSVAPSGDGPLLSEASTARRCACNDVIHRSKLCLAGVRTP